MKATDFYEGQQVWYVPRHARADTDQWEMGFVTGTTEVLVFVRFRGDELATACDPEDLEVSR